MAKVPFGTTISYAAFASAAGHPKAACAAGTACATKTHQDNLQRKAFLISHETQQLNWQSSKYA